MDGGCSIFETRDHWRERLADHNRTRMIFNEGTCAAVSKFLRHCLARGEK